MKAILLFFIVLLSITTVFATPQRKKKAKAKSTVKTSPPLRDILTPVPVKAMMDSAKVIIKSPLQFTSMKHDFGKIPKGIPVTYEFAFKNISDQPVVIESAKAQCGCTTPVFPKAAVAKGESDKITITYNASNPGSFMKQVTFWIAKYENPFYLVVSGEVLPSAP